MSDHYKKLSQDIGTPSHIDYLRKKDDRRHKSKCIYYNKQDKKCHCVDCITYTFKCAGSGHCDRYQEKTWYNGNQNLQAKNEQIKDNLPVKNNNVNQRNKYVFNITYKDKDIKEGARLSQYILNNNLDVIAYIKRLIKKDMDRKGIPYPKK